MQTKTSILAATSPQDNTSYHAFLLNVVDKSTGQKVFNVVNLMEVCAACLKTETPWTCVHAQDRLSWSKSKAARDETALFYRKGQEAVRGRELFGIASKNNSNLLPPSHVDQFFKSSISITNPVRALYLAIDPGGGGPGELGIVGLVETVVMEGPAMGGHLAVVLAASVSLNGIRAADTETRSIIGLINRIREDSRFQCPIVVMVESAPGIEASQVERLLRMANVPGVCVMRETSGGREGVPKTALNTEYMMMDLQHAIIPGQGGQARLVYWDGLITTAPPPRKDGTEVPVEQWPHKIKKKMREQMNNLRKVYPNKIPEHGDVRFKITAKVHGISPDDLLVALMMSLYWKDQFWNDSEGKYKEVHEMINNVVHHHFK